MFKIDTKQESGSSREVKRIFKMKDRQTPMNTDNACEWECNSYKI